MLDENNLTPQDEEPEESIDDKINSNNMTAGIISEDDFDTVGAYDEEFEGELLPDEETEVLPQLPDEIVEDWKRIQESDDGYLPENSPNRDDAPEDFLEDDVLSTTSKSLEKVESVLEETVDEVEFDIELYLETIKDAENWTVGGEVEFDLSHETTDDEDTEAVPEIEEKPYIPEPSKPAWKIHAEKLREEEKAKKQKMIDDRRAYEAERRAKQQAHLDEIRDTKRKADAQIKAKFAESQEKTSAAVDNMIQRVREEREQQRREQEAALEQLRREREERSYKNQRDSVDSNSTPEKPAPIKPTSRKPESDKPESDKPTSPKPASDKKELDLDARTSRLSKPEPEDDKP